MFGVSLGIKVGNSNISGGGFDADAQAYFSRVTTAGGTLTTTEQNAVNQLTIDMKAAGIWTSMKAVYPMVGASAAACAQNLKSSSFTGTFTSGWTFASTGVTPNGSGAYFNTGLNASTNLSISSSHISSYVNIFGNGGALMGINDLSGFMQPQLGNFYGSLATINFTSGLTSSIPAFYMVNRPSLTTQKLIKNSSIVLSESKTGTSYSSGQNFYIGAYSSSLYFSTARFAFASIGDGLTDAQASAFYTNIQNFNTTLSRNI